jgi:hypothetical protein
MFKRVPSARTKADSDMLLIAPTFSPTIGNTLVGRSFLSSTLKNYGYCEAAVIALAESGNRHD